MSKLLKIYLIDKVMCSQVHGINYIQFTTHLFKKKINCCYVTHINFGMS